MGESDIDAAGEVNLCSNGESDSDAPPAAVHVAGAPEAPGKPAGTAFERWALVLIVLAMVIPPTLEAAVRRFTGGSVPGAAVYTEHFTLLVGFLGAMLATATGHHLALSTVDFLPAGWPRDSARGFGSAVTTLVCAVLAYASLDMVLLTMTRVDTLAGGVPEWWFEVMMPVGFAVMSVRGALKAPTRTAKAVCWIVIAVVLPFIISRVLAVKGAGFLSVPDGPTLLRGHTGALGWPLSFLLFASFLLGAPVFVVMAGVATAPLLPGRHARRLRAYRDLPAGGRAHPPRHPAPHRRRLRARGGRRLAVGWCGPPRASSAGCPAGSP